MRKEEGKKKKKCISWFTVCLDAEKMTENLEFLLNSFAKPQKALISRIFSPFPTFSRYVQMFFLVEFSFFLLQV